MKEEDEKFSEETVKSIEKLGEVLRRIHIRLVSEGKLKKDETGKWVFIDENKMWKRVL